MEVINNNTLNDLENVKVRKILIVDDEAFNRMALRVIFDIIGIDYLEVCVEARNGLQAFEIIVEDIEQNNGKFTSFDLILMDFSMPIMDGNEASMKIREFLYFKKVSQPIITGLTGHIEQ